MTLSRSWIYLLKVCLFAACHLGLAWLVFQIPINGLGVWPLRLSAGLTQAVLLSWGPRVWPGITIGTFILARISGISGLFSVLFAVNDTLQALLGVKLLNRSGFQTSLGRLRDVVLLFAFAAISASAASATIGTLLIKIYGFISWPDLGESWLNWWIGNVTGVLTLMPVLLTWKHWKAVVTRPQRLTEAILWLVVSVGVSGFLFCSDRTEIAPYPLEYLPFPFLIWGALRFGQAGAALSTALVTNIATYGVAIGQGPFVAQAQDMMMQVLPSLQAYICVTALTGLTLAAIMAEREEARASLQFEKERSEQLLLNILPLPIADQLKQERRTIADSFAEVTVLFADIADFTKLSATLSAQELVALLNEIFSRFDDLAEKHGLEKIKTIGDAYMVVGGLPFPTDNHVEAIAEMALDMQVEMVRFSKIYQKPLAMRIGINTGPVVAGVIGTKKFIYDLWGDTVNTASRMESHGVVGQIQVTADTYARLRHRYQFEPRGTIHVKGKGDIQAFLLLGPKVEVPSPEPLLEG